MLNKKGASAIIGWILILGFTIGLATTVTLWMTRQTEEMTETGTKFVEGGMECDNVKINVQCGQEDGVCTELRVTNTGYLNIEKILIRKLDPDNPESVECPPPGSGVTLPVKGDPLGCDSQVKGLDWDGQIEVMPLRKVEGGSGGNIACQNKAITIKCSQCKVAGA